MNTWIFGQSFHGLPLLAYAFGTEGPRVLIVGGVHGDEVEGVQCAFGLIEAFQKDFPFRLQIDVVPALNLDGVLAKKRWNARDVDLNRNLPTRDWTSEILNPKYPPGEKPGSEPENQALIDYIENRKPVFIFSLHSYQPCLNINGNCSPEAEILAKETGYEIKEDMGYPTPGSLGTYAGLERGIPTITYEIERGQSAPALLKMHVPAIVKALKGTEDTRAQKT